MLIISLEGLDGCGKSTQCKMLHDTLTERGFHVGMVREPGGSDLGNELRSILLREGRIALWAEAYLFMAARAQMLSELGEYDILLCDRYIDSSVVYQGYARGLGIERIWKLSDPSIADRYPDTTLYIRVPYETCLERLTSRGKADRIESSGIEFFKRVYEGYETLSDQDTNRWITIDGLGTPEQVHDRIILSLRQRYTHLYMRI